MTGDPAPFADALLRWYDRARRDLPWRVPLGSDAGVALDPYHVLVSEAMLQQTQVAVVVPYFRRFLARFPTVAALAAADEQDVLRAWQGLGYYSRARNLRAAAQRIVTDHGGRVPSTVDELLSLPGVGRYTAGAVASIAFDRRVPILDGNVARVLCRLDAVTADPREPRTRQVLWARAEQVMPDHRPGDFNSALMELGATVCVPRTPQCLTCPVREYCSAVAAGIQDQVPPPKRAEPTPLFHRWTFAVRHGDRYLIEQRPATGRWAGMWQFVTVEPTGARPTARVLTERFGLSTSSPRLLGQLEHGLTHRRYAFDVYGCTVKGDAGPVPADRPRRWVGLAELSTVPLPRPHVKVAVLLVAEPGGSAGRPST